jgi:hypothetical protein
MEDRVLAHAKGLNGTLELLEDRIRIRRDGWTSALYGRRHHEEELTLPLVEQIELKKTAGGLAGYISFNGGTDPDCLEDLCVSFLLPQEHEFEAIKRAIELQRDRYVSSPQYQSSQLFVLNTG